jgi:hypothetical protein
MRQTGVKYCRLMGRRGEKEFHETDRSKFMRQIGEKETLETNRTEGDS